ncbi:interferon lambda receptor 1 isoform X1 [Elephas maximus indicus]|uniref:interferon lambda receptor 1 isoform X1 n=1 Tax=Elephas maximus indicus TaxID=99487 RepID=UPI0021166278|nr:interferon lambda receptor 1 isoform X1 [Elephas maximus indicus]
MAGARQWAPLLLCLLQSAPGQGRPRLTSPQNVTLLSRNFSVYLMWLPGPGNPQNVTYFVAYQSITRRALYPQRRAERCHDLPKDAGDGTRRGTQFCLNSFPKAKYWRKVKRCTGTKELVCCLMCLEKQDLYNKFKGRVKAVSPNATSPWVESKYLDYLSEVEPAPPTLVFTRTEEILSINATYQLPQCMPSTDLKYEVHFWKEGTRNKTIFPVSPHGQPVRIPLQPATSGHHCFSARTIYTFISSKYSELSKPTCMFLETSAISPPFLMLLSPLLLLLLVTATWAVIWKNSREVPWFQQEKMPQALDFSGHIHPMAAFQPSGPESPDDLTLSPQKELIRRVQLTPGVRASATLQAGSEKDSAEIEEEEDTGDSVSFQPYIEPPSFLGQEHQIPRCSEADGMDSGNPQTLVHVEGSSASGSSDTSWASTEDPSSWDEAGNSSYLAKKRPGDGLDGDGCWEPLPLPEFSEDSGSLEEPPKDDLWGSSAGLDLVPGELPVSLRTLTISWDSSPEEEEEEEEEDEKESETEDSGTGSWGAESSQRTESSGALLGHYMAR